MEKRKIIFGDYNTATSGLWTLTGWVLASPEQQTNYVEVPGGDPLDLSTDLTDGEPSYKSRLLTVTLESSEGTRLERKERIRAMFNTLHGRRVNIVLPDDADHYLTGRLKITEEYNDPAHAAVTVSATCDPWLWAKTERTTRVTATSSGARTTLSINGTRAASPVLTVTGSVTVAYGDQRHALSAGTYQLPGLQVKAGTPVTVTVSGSGSVTFTYREAVLQ